MMRKFHSHNPRKGRMNTPPPAPYVPKPVVTYGKAQLILEDTAQQTFEFKAGAWIPFEFSIVECRRDCLVKELPQKINNMTRYEVRFPLPT